MISHKTRITVEQIILLLFVLDCSKQSLQTKGLQMDNVQTATL